jgi:hypothetical protein
MLSSGPYSAFQKANQCEISMSPVEAGEKKDASHQVNLDVLCKNVNFADLSVRGLSYASKALKVTYNSVHNAVDTNALDNIVLAGPRLVVGAAATKLGNWVSTALVAV